MSLRGLRPSLLSSDLEATIAFYVGRLGFIQSGAYPSDGPPTWVELMREEVSLQFYSEAPTGTAARPVMSGTLYFVTEDVEALAAAFTARGVAFAWGPETMDYGWREFGLRDPDGYYLAFAQPL